MKILRRFRLQLFWLNLPTTLLITLLQRSPALKLAAVADEMVIASPLGAVLRSALAATASLGVMHTLAGATELSPSQPSPASGTVGTLLTIAFSITGTTSGPESWTVGGAVPPGMSFSGTSSETLVLGGTPTTAGSYTMSIQAEDGPTGFQSPTFSYTVNISGGVTAVAPSFTSHPSSQTVTEGSGVTFNVSADGTPAPTLQWHFNGSPIGGATGTSYSIGSVSAGNAGTYTVVATNSAGSVTSNGATLTVNPATIAPSISAHPASQTVNAGANVSFSVSASGTPAPSYQWRKDGADIGGANSPTLDVFNVQAGNAGTYTVLVSNSAGSVLSNGAVLAINVAPTITVHPSAQIVDESLAAQFSIAASGTPSPSYQWQRLPAGSGTWANLANDGNYSGVATPTLTVSGATMAMSGDQFRGVATNSVGSATSNAAALTVNARVPTIVSASPDQTIAPGASVELAVVPGGTAPFTYQWKLNGSDLGGANSATLNLANFQSANAGTYSLLVTNAAGTATATIILTLLTPPVITAHPANVSANLGANASFTVVASSTFAPGYQWQRQPAGGGGWADLANGGAYSGATSATLNLTGLAEAMSGDQFQCIVTNAAGSATSNPAQLTVVVPVPVITAQPTDQFALIGGAVTFSVTASSPVPQTYQWRKGGVDIPGAIAPTFAIPAFQSGDAGSYTVVVTNSGGSVTSNAATLVLALAPVITAHPATQTVIAGASPSFTVVASSNAPATYQWRKNGTDIPGATVATLTLANVQGGDAADYSVVVSNIAGSVTSNAAVLTVQLPPAITQQPVAAQPLPTMAATFTVAVSSTTPVTYQWQRLPSGSGIWSDVTNGGSSSGATSDTLTVANVQPAQDGDQYRCVVTNVAGSTTSEAALLTLGVAGNVKLSAGRYHSLRINTVAQLYVTGTNTYGQLGDGSTVSVTTPKQLTLPGQTVADIAAGAEHSLFLTSSGQVWAAGFNATGQLGDGTTTAKSTPALLTTNAAGIAAGRFHSAVLKADGTLWTTGGNDSGQLGNGTTTDTNTLAQVATDVVELAAGIRQTFFLKSDGTLWGMGDMNGSGTPVSTPVQLATAVKAVAAGGYHSLFLKTDGTLWALGYNPFGQLGTGDTTDRLTPVQVATGVKAIATGYFHSAFLKTDDSLWLMGYNSSGQLGDGTTANRPAPFQLATNVAAVTASEAYTLYTKTDGSLWGTGYNAYGQFGNGGTVVTTSPVQIATGVILAPEAPANLTATASVAFDRVRLLWTPQGSAASFEVWRHSTNNSASATLLASGVRWPVFEDRSVALGQAYYYWVKAVNPAGSTLSAPASASTGASQSQTITFTGPLDQPYTPTPLTLTATASSGLPVSFSLLSGPANLTGDQLTLTGVGTVTVRASQAGDASFDAAPNVDRTFTVSANFDSWELGYFTAPELADANVSGPNADPDGDGYANLVEYALGLEPKAFSHSGLPEVTNDATHWVYTYTRPEGRTDITFTVEVSTDLSGWGAPTVAEVLVSASGGVETWQAKQPLTSANAFFRLKVGLP